MRTIRPLALGIVTSVAMLTINAQAADLTPSIQWPWSQPDLYSDIPTYDWSGGYVAIMGGYNSTNIGYGDLAANMVDRTIPSWKWGEQARALAKASALDMTANAAVYSLHAGFNVMSQRLVYGAEIEYGKFSPAMNASSSFNEPRIVDLKTTTNSAGQTIEDNLGVRTTMSMKTQILDFGLVNARAGYAYGRFMPYALVGLGVTRVKANASMNAGEYHLVYVDGVYSSKLSDPDGTMKAATLTKDAYGATVSLGLGFEYAVLDNLILRAQYNYMTVGGMKGEAISNNMARGGLAFKF